LTVIELNVDLAQRRLVDEGAQQRVVAGTGLMCAGEDGIDDPEIRAVRRSFRSRRRCRFAFRLPAIARIAIRRDIRDQLELPRYDL
jgi:hypothetical protein